MILGSMFIFFSNKTVFPCPGRYFVLVPGTSSTWRTRRSKAVASLLSSMKRAIFLSPVLRDVNRSPCHNATLPRRTDAVFLYEVLASPRSHHPTPGTRRSGLPFPADASRASNPPEYEHEQKCFTCTRNSPCSSLLFSLPWLGQPCRHMLLIIYS